MSTDHHVTFSALGLSDPPRFELLLQSPLDASASVADVAAAADRWLTRLGELPADVVHRRWSTPDYALTLYALQSRLTVLTNLIDGAWSPQPDVRSRAAGKAYHQGRCFARLVLLQVRSRGTAIPVELSRLDYHLGRVVGVPDLPLYRPGAALAGAVVTAAEWVHHARLKLSCGDDGPPAAMAAGPTPPPANPHTTDDKIVAAVAWMVRNPDWSTRRVAVRFGLVHTTLSRSALYQTARQLANGPPPPRGRRTDDGRVDADDDDE